MACKMQLVTTCQRSKWSSEKKHGGSVHQKQNSYLFCVLLVFVLATNIYPCKGFFFPKSFFRKAAPNPPQLPPPPQHYPRGLSAPGNGQPPHGLELQGSGTDVHPSLRIVNRPNPPRNNDQLQQPSGSFSGGDFKIPKELCLACEKFPWMPVTGAEKQFGASGTTSVTQSQVQNQLKPLSASQSSTSTKTIVINALGEAQGPVPLPPLPPGRRPFAIQFDGGKTSLNQVNTFKETPKSQSSQAGIYPVEQQHQLQQQQNQQVQQQQQLQQQQQQQQNQQVQQHQQFQHQQLQQQQQFQQQHQQLQQLQQVQPERPVTFQIYQAQSPNQAPTVLQPVPQTQTHTQFQHRPIPVSQDLQQAYGRPTILHQTNIGIPLHTAQPSIPVQWNVKPGAPSGIPPPNPLAVGTIVAAQQNKQNLPEFQKIEQAKLVYQEHSTSQSSAQPPAPQNFRLPIIPNQAPVTDVKTPSEGYPTNNVPSRLPPIPQQPNYGAPPQENFQQPGQGLFLQMRPPAPYPMVQMPPPRPTQVMKPPAPMIHYGQPIRIPNNIGPQRPSGQVFFPPPQAFLQLGPSHPQPNAPKVIYGVNRPESNTLEPAMRPPDERRPSPSGQILNIQPPLTTPQSLPPPQALPPQNRSLITNAVPVPIPVPTTIQTSNTLQDSDLKINGQGGHGRPEVSTFTQETGWEIIPSIQTDLTHLFDNQGKQSSQGGHEIPVPVPIPVPQSHPPKSPFFIVTNANQQEKEVATNSQIKVKDVTYHEEQRNPLTGGSSQTAAVSEDKPKGVEQQVQIQSGAFVSNQNEHQIVDTSLPPQPIRPPPPQVIRPRPFILGVPTGPPPHPQVIFRPRPQNQFDPLPPSIMTALNHAQQTSLLTHQYLSQSNVGQPLRENTIYIGSSVPPGLSPQSFARPANPIFSESASNSVQNVQETNKEPLNLGIDPRIPINRPGADHSAVNCQSTKQWLVPLTTHQKQQQIEDNPQQPIEENASSVDQSISSAPTTTPEEPVKSEKSPRLESSQDAQQENESLHSTAPEPTVSTFEYTPSTSQGIRGSVNVEDNGNKGSYVLYYPRPVSKSPVYWVQPSRTLSQGVVRLSPQFAPVSPVTSSLVSWSRPRVVVANQFRTDQSSPKPTQEVRAEESYEKEEQEGSSEQQVSEQTYNEDIPYGQKLGATRDNTDDQKPYDIISVHGSDDDAQSIEETNSRDNSQRVESSETPESNNEDTGDFTSSSNDETVNNNNENIESNNSSPGEYIEDKPQLQNENYLQNVQDNKGNGHDESYDADDEQDDFAFRPQTSFRKPISTTVIHSPGSSSFQSLKLPNFKPQRVIVHDFTGNSANIAAGPSASAGELQGNLESSESQQAISSEAAPNSWSQPYKNKAQFVETVGKEDVAHSSMESINRPQGLNIQEVVSSGPSSTADCITTTHTGLSFISSTSPRTAKSQLIVSDSKNRDGFISSGSRFPGGRPSIFSAVRRPVSAALFTTPASATSSSTLAASSEYSNSDSYNGGNRRDPQFVQNPTGFAASIPVPIYRRPNTNHNTRESQESTKNNKNRGDDVVYIRPQSNILSAEDIYKNSEVKDDVAKAEDGTNAIKGIEHSTTVSSPVENETVEPTEESMLTEKSSSFSVSFVNERGASSGLNINDSDRPGLVENNDLKLVDDKIRPSKTSNVVHVTSIPVLSNVKSPGTTLNLSTSESITSTTAIPAPASTSTKIVKTVRVRQRMRSGSLGSAPRTRFHGPGRVRVVHRPANQEYIRHFPEFATHEGDKLAKEEEQAVKNALIELKKSTDST